MDPRPYSESLSSPRTEALFLVLSGLSLAAFGASRAIGGPALTAALSLGLFLFFAFYSLNYRVLHIRITSDELRLRFGLVSWKIPRGNVNGCSTDTVSLWRIGGAGISFHIHRRSLPRHVQLSRAPASCRRPDIQGRTRPRCRLFDAPSGGGHRVAPSRLRSAVSRSGRRLTPWLT